MSAKQTLRAVADAHGWSEYSIYQGRGYGDVGPVRFGWWARSVAGAETYLGRTADEAEARLRAGRFGWSSDRQEVRS